MTMQDPFREDLISEIFGDRPELSFLGQLGQANLPQNMEDFFRGQTSNFLQRFQQQIGQQLSQGELPTVTPQDFFGGIDFQQEFQALSPRERGLSTSGLSNRTRFLF